MASDDMSKVYVTRAYWIDLMAVVAYGELTN